MPRRRTPLSSLLIALLAASAQAQSSGFSEVALSALSMERKAIVVDRMELTERESGEFWPIYSEYLSAHEDLTRELGGLVRRLAIEFHTLDDDTATELLGRYHEFRRERLELRYKTAKKLRKKLGGKLAGRFYQLENKLDTLTDMDLVKAVPLIE